MRNKVIVGILLVAWRFAIATVAGVVPASFLLAHLGSQLTTGNAERIVTVPASD